MQTPAPESPQERFTTDPDSRFDMPQTRRRGSTLGEDLRGDTGAPAMSTLNAMPHIISPPLTPPLTPTPSEAKLADAKPSPPSRTSKRRKARSLFKRWKTLSFRHTWVNPLILTLLILLGYLVNPSPSNLIHSMIFLSYRLDRSHPHVPLRANGPEGGHEYYGKGARDFAFVGFYIIVLSFTREFLMQRVIRPIAIRYGIRARAKQARFMEQYYTAIYFSIMGPYGLYVMSRTPVWYFNTMGMFEEFPIRAHEGVFKAYYLLQASYWAQQAIVLLLQLEAPRKDYYELVGHHIVTITLIWCSYRFHFTYMGLAVYITHDVSDFFLATSKCLSYVDSSIVIPYFTIFMSAWIYLRHYLNLRILWATLTIFRTVGPFELNWETQQYKCWLSQYIAFSLLSALQAINLFWLYLIIKIALTVVFSSEIRDVRSDDEEEPELIEDAPTMNGKMNGKMNGTANGNANGNTNGNGHVANSTAIEEKKMNGYVRPQKHEEEYFVEEEQ
ncbi:hypothetical protein MMC25_007307 [Agyrium rufum]|nr:hypothetical protein [Agyrium rufum]